MLDVATNDAKLSLSSATVGDIVRITDGFLATQGSGLEHFAPFKGRGSLPTTYHGKPVWVEAAGRAIGTVFYAYAGTAWSNIDSAGDDSQFENPLSAAAGNETYPWQADWSGTDFTLIHPATEILAEPSDDIGGVYVSGASGGSAQANGVYQQSLIVASDGKYDFVALGAGEAGGRISSIMWLEDDAQWVIYSSDGTTLFTSSEDVETPDLVAEWAGAGNAITVTALAAGAMSAGLRIASNTYIRKITPQAYVPFVGLNKKNIYTDVAGVQPDLTWNGTQWSDGNGHTSASNTAFPWDATWSGITVARNDIANEENWIGVAITLSVAHADALGNTVAVQMDTNEGGRLIEDYVSGFSVKVNGVARAVDYAYVSAHFEVTVFLYGVIYSTDTVTLSITSSDLTDDSSGPTLDAVDVAVTNNSAVSAPSIPPRRFGPGVSLGASTLLRVGGE